MTKYCVDDTEDGLREFYYFGDFYGDYLMIYDFYDDYLFVYNFYCDYLIVYYDNMI